MRNILIIDDDFSHRILIKNYLKKNFKFRECCDLSEAKEFLSSNSDFSLILLDQNLPDGCGTDFYLNHLSKSYPGIPTILMTSFGSEELVVKCFRNGMSDYFIKNSESFLLLPEIVERVMKVEEVKKERDHLLNKLQDSLEREKDLHQAKTQLFSMIGHDLKTPLNSIIGFSRRIMKKEGERLSPEYKKSLEKVIDNGHYLHKLVIDILDFNKYSRLENLILNESEMSMENCIERCFTVNAYNASEKNISLKFISETESSSERYHLDWIKLEKILNNLILNAIEASAKGKVIVRHQTKGLDEVLKIEDQGTGMTKEELSNVLDESFKLKEKTNKNHNYGLGLATVKNLCKLLKIDISYESRPSHGTTVTLCFSREKIQT